MVRKIGQLKRRGNVANRKAVRRVEQFNRWLVKVDAGQPYPWNSPGMPPPGPDFRRYAEGLGDGDTANESYWIDDPGLKSGRRKKTRVLWGGILEDLYTEALRSTTFRLPILLSGGRHEEVEIIPGHIWGEGAQEIKDAAMSPVVSEIQVTGPRRADIMLLGKMPGLEESTKHRNLIGPAGELLLRKLAELRIQGYSRWYVTNLVKFRPPDESSTLRAAWFQDCLPLLHQELRMVRPKYILCLGADASKALLGSKATVTHMEGRVVEYEFPTGVREGDEETHKALVMTIVHPSQVARDQSLERQMERGLARFNLLRRGIRFDKEELGVQHDVLTTVEELREALQMIEHDPDKRDSLIGMDAEWHGEHAVNKNAYLRTVQLAWKPKHAIVVKLRGPGGVLAFKDSQGRPALQKGIGMLRDFINGREDVYRRKRVVGHFFTADLEFLIQEGLEIQDAFRVPLHDLDLRECDERRRKLYRKAGFTDLVPAWYRTRYEGGFDTGAAAHAIEETARYNLESLLVRYTTVPRYDVSLQNWKETYCKEQGISASHLEGYGDCPDHVLCPTLAERKKHGTLNYAAYDADGTLRLCYEQQKLLDCDYDGNCCREAFWETMIALPAILEMHRTGIVVDRDRIDHLTVAFMKARTKQEQKIRRWARWPEFNIRSVQHVREFLFGEGLNGKKPPPDRPDAVIRIRPVKGQPCEVCEAKGSIQGRRCPYCFAGETVDGRSLYVSPLLTTSKPPKLWQEVASRGKVKEYSPSTNKTVLAILAQDNLESSDQINWIRDYRFLDTALKSALRPPSENEEGEWVREETEDGSNLIYDAGLVSQICDDGRVRTHIYPTKETGRWSSARPPLHTFSKQRDPDYARLLAGDYKYKLRSVLKASPGHVLLEADYVGAELFLMAILSGDSMMIDHATRNQLPEDHSDYYDIHSNVAVLAFLLDCPPTKSGLKAIAKSHLRIIAKSVIFGIAYGRGAKAIALAAREQGVRISVDDAQVVIDTIFALYAGLRPLFEACCVRSRGEVELEDGVVYKDPSQRWLCHCFGRFRRFPLAGSRELEAEFERQAMNFPIQGGIAGVMDRGIAYLEDYKRRHDPRMFRILLAIHDAILLEVPDDKVKIVATKVLPMAMRRRVPIYPTDVTGVPTGKGPYYLGLEAEVMNHWGELLGAQEAQQRGLPTGEWAKDGVVVKFSQVV